MMTEVDIFVGNYTIIDEEIYDLWIQGFVVQQAVLELEKRGILDEFSISQSLLHADVIDNYRTFDMLEKLLLVPTQLVEEWTFQIRPQIQKRVIEKYYGLDDVVMREIIGKKLSSRIRKDLDEVSEKTGVQIRSCRRQFNNVKRIFKQVEDMPGSVAKNIQSQFLLSTTLAQKYGAVVFLMDNRFETNKRKLNYLSFEDFAKCVSWMMVNWTSVSQSPEERDDTELDRDFLANLRDLKVLHDKEKEHRNVAVSHLRGKISDRLCTELESNFKMYSRALINIACGLNNSRDLRDFFIDTVEKIVDPCRQARWQSSELETFLNVYYDTGSGLDIISSDKNLHLTWQRYMETMRLCVVQLYPS